MRNKLWFVLVATHITAFYVPDLKIHNLFILNKQRNIAYGFDVNMNSPSIDLSTETYL